MHLSQQSRKSSNGELLLGLIDGAQAIILTLLVIEMPVLIIEIIEHAEALRMIALPLITPISLVVGIISGQGFALVPLVMLVLFVFV